MKYSKKLHDWVRENKSVIVKVMGEADNPGVFHAYSLAEISHILLDEIERLREQTIDYENDIFLGQTIEYWIRIKAQLDADNSDQLVREILLLKAELARRDEIITRLKEDGERMADFFIEGERGNGEVFVCIYCDAPPKFQNRKLEHEEYCPVSKHDALMKELE